MLYMWRLYFRVQKPLQKLLCTNPIESLQLEKECLWITIYNILRPGALRNIQFIDINIVDSKPLRFTVLLQNLSNRWSNLGIYNSNVTI